MKRKIRLLWLMAESFLPSRIRVALLRMRGARIGPGVRLGRRAVLECGGLTLGTGCAIGAGVRVRVRGKLVLGESVQIGARTKIGAAEVSLGDETIICSEVMVEGSSRFSTLTTGRRCYIGDRCYLDLSHGVTFGEEVGVGLGSSIFTHGSWQSELEGFPIANGAVKVDDFAWIGSGCMILAGAQIGEFATVGAAAVVRGNVPAYSLAVGNPGKVVLTNGRHMMPPLEPAQFDICRTVIKEASANQEWLGVPVEVVDEADSCTATIEGRTIILKPLIETPETAGAVVSLQRMSDGVILQLEAAGCDWFDVSRRRCSRPFSPLHGILRSQFSSHGIRFQPVDRGAIASAADGKTGRKPAPATASPS